MRFRSVKHLRWYAGATIFLVALHVVGLLSPVERLAAVPTNWLVNKLFVSTSGMSTSFSSWRSTVAAKELLPAVMRQRDELEARVALVESENATLRRQLAYPERNAWGTIGADVVAKTTDISEQAFIVNRGSSDGVAVDDVVFTENGVLVGRVARVEDARAVVRLLNDRASRVGALLGKSGRAIGIVEGGYGLGVRLTLIPPEEVVAAGDTLVTDASDDKMPAGLLIGSVVTVGRETYEPFQHALLNLAIPFEQIKTVSIILHK